MSTSKLFSIDDSTYNNQDTIEFKSKEIFIQDIVLNETQPEYKKMSLKKEYQVFF
jgi:hypothetical protein